MNSRKFNILKIKDITKAYQLFLVIRLVVLVAISIILVKSSYTKAQTSGFERFLFTINISTFFWLIGTSNAMLSYFPKLEAKKTKRFFKSVFILLQSIGIIVAISIYATQGFTIGEAFLHDNNKITILTALYVLFLSPTLIIETKYILENKIKSLLSYGFIIYFLQFSFVVLAIILYDNLISIFIAMTIWIAIRWIWTIWIVFRDNPLEKISLKVSLEFMIFSLPIVVHILLGNGMEYIDGILVDKYFPKDMFSVYKYGAREFPLFLILIGAIRNSVIPKAVLDIEATAEIIKQKTNQLINWIFPLSILLVLSSKYLFSMVYNEDYQYSALLFNIYLIIITSRILLPEVFIYAKHENKVLMYVSFFEIILNIVVSFILLKYWGITGIVLATFIVFSLSKLYLVIHVRIKYNIKLEKYINLRKYIIFSFLLILSFAINYLY